MLPLIPLTIIAVALLLPGVRNRMLQGFGDSGVGSKGKVDDYEVTAGRTLAWSYVIPKIKEAQIFGYGREAMIRTGIYQRILDEYGEGETFPHPHNAYLQLLLDNGWFGFFLVIPFYVLVLKCSFTLLLDRQDVFCAAVGGVACSLLLALLVAGMGSQTFYPREGSVGMWAAIGVMLRVYVERARSKAGLSSVLFGGEQQPAPVIVESERTEPSWFPVRL
jgi:O-antigen ligase